MCMRLTYINSYDEVFLDGQRFGVIREDDDGNYGFESDDDTVSDWFGTYADAKERALAFGTELAHRTPCAAGCGRVLSTSDLADVGMVVCRDCGIADMEAKHGADWDAVR